MSLQTATALLRSPRLITPLVVISANFYLPTVGVGTENTPNLAAQGALVAVSLAAAALGLADRRVRALILRSPLVFAFILAGWMAISALQSNEPLDGVARGIWFAAVALVVTWTVVVERWDKALLVLAAPLAGFVLISVLAYPFADVGFQGNEFFNERLFPWPRFRGLSANHTVIGLSGALIASAALSVGSAWGRTTALAIFAAGVVGVLASHSRAAIGALVLGALVEVAQSRRDLIRPVAAGALMLVGVWLLTGGGLSILDRSEAQELVTASVTAETGFLTGRGNVWAEAFDFAMARPLTGNGVGAFASQTATQFDNGIRQWDPVHAHNAVLEIFVDQGLVGVFNLVALGTSLVVLRSHVARGSISMLAIVAAHSMVEGLFYGSPTTGWVMAVAVLAATAASDSNAEGIESSDPPAPDQRHRERYESDHRQTNLATAENRR